MEAELDLRKTLRQNADLYYSKSKKARNKLEGVKKALKESKKQLKEVNEKKQILENEKVELKKKRPVRWFEKFHWFYTSNNTLVIGGKDTKSNETVVKKHMEPNDVYFHAEVYGAPHIIAKIENDSLSEDELQEIGVFSASYSRAWREKVASANVYWVKPDQVSKEAPSGEHLGTGSFMIRGKKNYIKKAVLKLAIGVVDSVIVCGPKTAIKQHTKIFKEITPGDTKPSDVAKTLKTYFEKETKEIASLDEIIKMLPPGNSDLVE
ncbi:MAG: DUF814 domain-containing protein [Candidatus Diapherotrites archaeon]|nr:DUF814 domain-containing protein [Candidatus Diapherotrites archaeon]